MSYAMPGDVRDAYDTLRTLMFDMDDVMTEAVKEWGSDLRADMRAWRDAGKEPDWEAHRATVNEMLADSGYSKWFTLEQEEC